MDNRTKLINWLEQINATQARRQGEYGNEVLPYLQKATSTARNMIMKALYDNKYDDIESIHRAVKSAKTALQPSRVSKIDERLERLQAIRDLKKDGNRYGGGTAHDAYTDAMDQIMKVSRDRVRSWDSQEVIDAVKYMSDQGNLHLWSSKEVEEAIRKLHKRLTPEDAFGEKALGGGDEGLLG